MDQKYGALRGLGSTYKIIGYMVLFGGIAVFFMVAAAAREYAWISIPAGLATMGLGLSMVAAGQALEAAADTAQAARETAAQLAKLIEIQAQAAADLRALADTVRRPK
jgi:hypothetical protein